MSERAIDRRRKLRVVFLLRSLGYVRLFDPVIRGLLERGHRVHLLHEREKYTEQELGWLRELEQQPGFSWSLTDALYHDRWAGLANVLRRTTDYVHFRGPAFAGASPLVTRAEGRAHLPAQRLMRSRFMRIEAVRRTFWLLLDALERSLPSNRDLEAELRELAPDVLVLVPHLMPGGRHSEYVKAARATGIPTCMCIASWDNLSSKQQLRDVPDRVVVWNRFQRDEAVRLHGMPDEPNRRHRRAVLRPVVRPGPGWARGVLRPRRPRSEPSLRAVRRRRPLPRNADRGRIRGQRLDPRASRRPAAGRAPGTRPPSSAAPSAVGGRVPSTDSRASASGRPRIGSRCRSTRRRGRTSSTRSPTATPSSGSIRPR